MFPYYIVFAVTILLTYVAENFHRNKLVFYLSLTFAVLIPSLLAGLRDYDIGTDVMWYAYDAFNDAKASNSLSHFINNNPLLDKGYCVVAYFCSKIFVDAHGLLFITEIIIITPIIVGITLLRKEISMPIAIAIYLLSMYNPSLNTMRQNMAVSVCFLAFVLFLKDKRLLSLLFMAIAYFFHSTSLIFLLFLGYAEGMLHWGKVKFNRLHLAILLVIPFLFISYTFLLETFLDYGFLKDDYSRYLNPEKDIVGTQRIVASALELAGIFFVSRISYSRIHQLAVLVALSFIAFLFLRFISQHAGRLALYPQVLFPIIYGMYFKFWRKTKHLQYGALIGYKFLVCLIFYQLIVGQAVSTIPYKSMLLNAFF